MLKTPRREPESLSPFECAAGDPAAWQEAAHNLIGCANIILDTLRVRQGQDGPAGSVGTGAFWRTPMMLYGLAVENLIKAIIVARKPASDVCFPLSDGRFPPWFTRHDLLALAKRADLGVFRSQEHLLRRLKVFVEFGKYPVGLREGQDRPTRVFSDPIGWNDVFQLLEYPRRNFRRQAAGTFWRIPAYVESTG